MKEGQDQPIQWRSQEAAASPTPPWAPAAGDRLRSWVDGPIDRRQFMKLIETTLAMAGLQGCWPRRDERAMPYVKSPEYGVAGLNQAYATTMVLQGYAYGVIGRCFEGKPQKIDGNPDHPATRGTSNALIQASVLDLYDPDRLQAPLQQGQTTSWEAFTRAWAAMAAPSAKTSEKSLRLLTGHLTSPTLIQLIQDWLKQNPHAQWHHYEALHDDNLLAGTALAFGRPLRPLYRFDQAKRVAAFDADFLAMGPSSLCDARNFADARDPNVTKGDPCRLYVAEPSPTITGTMADHRLPIPPQTIASLLQALARALQIPDATIGTMEARPLEHAAEDWVAVLARDLMAHPGASLVIVGPSHPAAVQRLAWVINEKLGALPQLVTFQEPIGGTGVSHEESLRTLVDDMRAGHVRTLLILGQNPAFLAPDDLRFADALAKVPHTVYHGLYANETAGLCAWQLPESHYLEAWGDACAFDGTVSLGQPLISPLFASRSALEVLAIIASAANHDGYALLRDHWRREKTEGFEDWWRRVLHDGHMEASGSPAVSMNHVVTHNAKAMPESQASLWAPSSQPEITLHLQPDPVMADGRFANNPWLQELPHPLTSLTWGNAALISPALAKALNLSSGDRITVTKGRHNLEIPALIMPGQAEYVITVALGYGRRAAGRIGTGVGANAYPMRSAQNPWWLEGVTMALTGRQEDLALTQKHHDMESRRPVQVREAASLWEKSAASPPPAMVKPMEGPTTAPLSEPAWGMVIDLNRCIGCSACVVACQAENSIPSVGKEEVLRGREMHWIRVDRYFEGDEADPAMHHQPVPCMHCEHAPCEYVCPVGATVHDAAGLNEMVYNRCVGTRYCSNNCPYKVRRFNFFHYSDQVPELSRLQRNPNVSVRARGIMEKCTYCIQRISAARIEAEKAGRPLRGDDVVPACAQACPTQAISFGDVKDPMGSVGRRRQDPRHYALLEELDTKPRTTYLAKVIHPNPEMKGTLPTREKGPGDAP